MTPLAFIDCGRCATRFRPRRRGQRFCSKSCASAVTAAGRSGKRNANWRGGRTERPLYEPYLDMIARRTRPTHHAYGRYGGRGITVHERWRVDFWAFVDDMGERPEGHSLDRVDNDGPCSPENCRWATASQQQHNRRTSGWERRERNTKGQFA